MENRKKVAVIGGTGKAGKYLVEQLLSQGYQCKLLIRNPEHLSGISLLAEVVHGDARDYHAIRMLVDGCNAVISTLGLGLPPSEPTIFSRSTVNVIKSMIECNVGRYIVVTGLNVDTPLDKKSQFTAQATDWMKASFPVSTADKQEEYRVLSESDIDYTLVRVPVIKQTELNNEITVSLQDCPGTEISATALAHFLVAQLQDNRYFRKAPFIANV
jgi:putative NADH-flavin reductase